MATMFVEEIKLKRGRKQYRCVLVRETYRHNGKVLHRTVANLSKLPAGAIELVRQFLRRKGQLTADGSPLLIKSGREYGASRAFHGPSGIRQLAKIDQNHVTHEVTWVVDGQCNEGRLHVFGVGPHRHIKRVFCR